MSLLPDMEGLDLLLKIGEEAADVPSVPRQDHVTVAAESAFDHRLCEDVQVRAVIDVTVGQEESRDVENVQRGRRLADPDQGAGAGIDDEGLIAEADPDSSRGPELTHDGETGTGRAEEADETSRIEAVLRRCRHLLQRK